jgi:hypothetical protein
MRVETGAPEVKPVDFELMLPYSAVKAIFSAADISSLGFIKTNPQSV